MQNDKCNEPGPIKSYNFDEIPGYCKDDNQECSIFPGEKSLNDVPGQKNSWFEEKTLKQDGIGVRADCDPMLKGHIINEQNGIKNNNVVYRYNKSLRGTDEAVRSLFNDIVVLDTNSQAHPVPLIWGTQEKAVIAVLGENYRKDSSLVVDRIKLPIMSINSTSYDMDMSRYVYHKAENYLRDYKTGRPGFTVKEFTNDDTVYGLSKPLPINIGYTLYVWTMYEEDINQILEQIYPKIMPMGYIRVKGIGYEIPVKLDSIGNNIEYDTGDRSTRVIKYQINMTAESYLAQPIHRKKAVLKTRTEIVNSIDEDSISDIITKLEEAVEELQ